MTIKKLLIDVRTQDEYDQGHRDGAINIPIEHIMNGDIGILSTTDKDTEIECYCLSGARAEYAVHVLGRMGYSKVKNGGGL